MTTREDIIRIIDEESADLSQPTRVDRIADRILAIPNIEKEPSREALEKYLAEEESRGNDYTKSYWRGVNHMVDGVRSILSYSDEENHPGTLRSEIEELSKRLLGKRSGNKVGSQEMGHILKSILATSRDVASCRAEEDSPSRCSLNDPDPECPISRELMRLRASHGKEEPGLRDEVAVLLGRIKGLSDTLAVGRRYVASKEIRDLCWGLKEIGPMMVALLTPPAQSIAAVDNLPHIGEAFISGGVPKDAPETTTTTTPPAAEKRWIPVSEQFPGDGVAVLVSDGRHVGIAWRWAANKKWGPVEEGLIDWNRCVTHWMSTPEPPVVEIEARP